MVDTPLIVPVDFSDMRTISKIAGYARNFECELYLIKGNRRGSLKLEQDLQELCLMQGDHVMIQANGSNDCYAIFSVKSFIENFGNEVRFQLR
jgi:phosphotransferase system HPr-like phosphotransfer protein